MNKDDDTKTVENESNGIETNHSSDENTRRKFIKKTTVGAIITTLPAKSVWGICTVSGALSGGSQQTQTCEIPPPVFLSGGRSTGFWRGESSNNGNGNGNAGGNFHGGFSNHGPNDENCIKAEILALQKSTAVLLDEENGIVLEIYNALQSNGSGDSNFAFHLAGAYLNAYYGFYPLPFSPYGINTAEDLVKHLYAASMIHGVSAIVSAIEGSYTEGESEYEFNC